MAEIKVGDMVVRRDEFLREPSWNPWRNGKQALKVIKVRGTMIYLEGMTGNWEASRFDLARKEYDSKEVEELYTMGYRHG